MSSINSLRAIIQQALSGLGQSSSSSSSSSNYSPYSQSSTGISNANLAGTRMGSSCSGSSANSSGLTNSGSGTDFASELTSIITQAIEQALEEVMGQMTGSNSANGSGGDSSGLGGDSSGSNGLGSDSSSLGGSSGLTGSTSDGSGISTGTPSLQDQLGGATGSNTGSIGTAPSISGAYGPGSSLATNQAAASKQLDAMGASPQEKAICLAIGMQETNNMSVDQRDASKDSKGGAANVSAFNLNADMLKQLGCTNPQALNDPSKQGEAMGYMLKAMRTWGVDKFLNYQRGGSTGFADGVSYDCAGYRNAITQSAQKLMTNGLQMGSRTTTGNISYQ